MESCSLQEPDMILEKKSISIIYNYKIIQRVRAL